MPNNYKNEIKKYWLKVKPSLKIFGSMTWMLTKIGIVFALAIAIGGAGMGTGMMVGALKDVPAFDPDVLESPALPSYIYDTKGDLITQIHDAQNRTLIKMEDVPDHLRDAFLAAEDNNFFNHSGFDIQGIARAVYNNLVSGDSHGGSTITQQIVKQVYLSKQKTIIRKLQELYIAVDIERQYTKEEIFEFYINNATFYGNSAWGVEAAAQTYFGKSASDVTLAEGAMLAGIPNYPDYYSPNIDDMEPSIKRRNDVLRRMVNHGFITQAEANEAMEEVPAIVPRTTAQWPYPHYVDAIVHTHAIEALMETGHYETKQAAAQAIRRDGLHIYTAMDPRIQQQVQTVMFDDKYYPVNTFVYPEGHSREGRRYPQGAALVMDAKTGHILGLVGGREYSTINRLNRYNSMFQPGSAIKPVLVYGPAFELGVLSPASTLDDSPTAWPGSVKDYTPENFARTFKGLVTVRAALTNSDNIPAIKAYETVMKSVGAKVAAEFAQKLGISDYGERNKNNPRAFSQLGIALGAEVVTPLEMTQAYSAFANKGVSTKPIFVTKIVDRHGSEIYTESITQEVVMTEQTAFLMTDVLRDVVTRGTARPSGLSNYNVAAKTGTTNDAHDRWTVGYSSDYVFTVWLGNDNKQAIIDGKTVAIPGTSSAGYNRINDMFGTIVKGVIGKNNVPFNARPSGLTRATVCAKSGLLPTELCSDTVTDWFLNTAVPTEICNMHILVKVCTTSGLLATDDCPEHLVVEKVFLNRDIIEPTDERWSGAIGRLPNDYNLRPPTEYCTLHGPTYSFSIDGNTLNWEWTQPVLDDEDSAPRFIGFNIYRTAFGVVEKLNNNVLAISTRSFTVPAQAPGMKYDYKLVLVNDINQEVQRHDPISHTRSLGITLAANATDNIVQLSWNSPSLDGVNNGINLAGYKIYRNGQAIHTANANVNNYEDVVMEVGMYDYKVTVIYKVMGQNYETPVGATKEIMVGEDSDPGDPDPGDPDPGDDTFLNPSFVSLA